MSDGQSSSAARQQGPLHGIRVLDFTAVMAGPHCTRLLADLGAEVIKIETLEGDMIRGRPPLRDGHSSYFGQLNCGKKSLALDLKSAAGRTLVHRLATICDVVVENFRPGVMKRLGFDYETFAAANSGLIYCSISGFGQTGPVATRAAYAPIIHAACGYDAANLGYQKNQDRPGSTGIFIADVLGGTYAFGAIQAALFHRERSGAGQYIDVSLMDSMLNLMVFECQDAQFPDKRRRPVYSPLSTRDGHVIIAPISQKNFEQMADAIGRLDWKNDPRFSTNRAREQNWDALTALIETWTQARDGAECERVMEQAGVPCSRFVSVGEALRELHLKARGSLAEVHDSAGAFTVPNPPFQFSASRAAAGDTVAGLGADGADLLQTLLGCAPDEIAALQEQGVLLASMDAPRP